MLKKLLSQLFDKLENERDNDEKSKNGNAIYFVEEILEKRYGRPNYISSKAVKSYYDKYIDEKENNAGEPSSELKNLMSKYLGYENFLDFENKNGVEMVGSPQIKGGIKKTFARWAIFIILDVVVMVVVYSKGFLSSNDCLVWKIDHYEKVDCENNRPNLILEDVDIDFFRQVKVSDTTAFFVNGHPAIWYVKSKKGEIEYFNSRGLHPITLKELKPITQYIINKYVDTTKNQN